MTEAQQLIERLQLQPLQPEGGYFARTWTSREVTSAQGPMGTAIYFLLTPEVFSAFHRLKSDELWHFYAGDPVEHWQLSETRSPERTLLGSDVLAGELPQLTVRAGRWQAAEISPQQVARGWSLIGCTLSPGWRDEDFDLGEETKLRAYFAPPFQSLAKFCRR